MTMHGKHSAKQTAGRVHRVGDRLRLQRVAVVRKLSAIELLSDRPDQKLRAALDGGDPLARRVTVAHLEHLASLEVVEAALRARGLDFRVVTTLNRRLAGWADLIVTVGGDGTFLSASHAVESTADSDGPPMLGVNSATSSSIGYFCATAASGVGALLDQVATGQLTSRGLGRMVVQVNGRPLRDLALNDVLLAHRVPAETTRYLLQLGDRSQDQKSSGIWIATPAGSTAAIRSAGGDILSLDRRDLQFRVRELMTWAVKGPPLAGGCFVGELNVVSRMLTGTLYIDGGHLRVPFGFGDRLGFAPSPRPLGWLVPPSFNVRRQAIVAGSEPVPS